MEWNIGYLEPDNTRPIPNPLFDACKNGDLDLVIELLLDPEIDINSVKHQDISAFDRACEMGHIDICQTLLIDPRLDLTDSNALIGACMNSHNEIIKIILEDGRIDINRRTYDSALHCVCRNKNIEMLRLFLENPLLDINVYGSDSMTAVHLCSKHNLVEVIKLLLDDDRTDCNAFDYNHDTPFSTAYWKNHIDIVKILLNHNKCDPFKHEKFPFHKICYLNDHIELIKLLLADERFDPSIQDDGGQTCLHSVCFNNDVEKVKVLLNDGRIDPFFLDNEENTAFDVACQNGNTLIIRYLLSEFGDKIVISNEIFSDAIEEIISPLRLSFDSEYLNVVALHKYYHSACFYNKPHIVENLLKDPKLEPNRPSRWGKPFDCVCYHGHTEIVKLFLEDDRMEPPIILEINEHPFFNLIQCTTCISLYKPDIIKLLLSSPKVDLTKRYIHDTTIFHLIFLSNSSFYIKPNNDAIKILLDYVDFDIMTQDDRGNTPLL